MTERSQLSLERAVLVTVGLGGMLIPLNSTMIAVGLPSIGRDLDASVAQTGWLITAYLIVMASFQPIAGKLGDRYGRRMFLLGGYLGFGAASVLAARAMTPETLIAARAGQALAGSVIFPNGSALLRTIVPEERRGARFGLLGASIAFGAAVGPPLGGALISLDSWRLTFWFNVPLCALVLAIAWRTIPRERPERSATRFDLVGSGLLAVILATGAWLLTNVGDLDASLSLAVGGALVVLFVVFLRHELRTHDPVVQPRFFKRRVFASATAAIAASNVALYVLLITVPVMLFTRYSLPESKTGTILASMSVGMVVLAPIGGRLSDRLGRRIPAVVGMGFIAVGSTSMAITGGRGGTGSIVFALVLTGIGLGLGSGSLQTSAVEAIEPEHAGMASGASATARYVGSIVGSAVFAGTADGGYGVVLTFTAVCAIASVFFALGLAARRPGQLRRASDTIAT
ncbi:MAG: MFS transporter [Actinomycetota bacterium]